MSAPARMPVHVLTGFLGSGKTTLLNRLLRSEALPRAAVIVNELGDIAIDHLLVEHSDDRLVQLAGGCLCCAVRGDLARTLAELLARRDAGTGPDFERVVIETTGLADPAPVLNLLSTDPLLSTRMEAGAVVTTVDAVSGASSLDAFAEAVKQVALADVLVVTKADISPLGAELVEGRVAALNPRASIRRSRQGDLTAGPSGDGGGAPAGAAGLFARAADPAPLEVHPEAHRHADGIDTFTFVREAPVPGAALALLVETLAEQLGPDLLRVKGLVRLREAPERPAVLQGMQHVFHPLDFLPRWPDGDRRTRLVFIARRLSPAWVGALLDAIESEVAEIEHHVREGTCSI